MTRGTPKTLDEAIANSLCIGLLKDLPDNIYWSVKDYLAQRFGVALLTAKTENEKKLLEDLWKSITRRKR